jgi:serine/threonine protein kinase
MRAMVGAQAPTCLSPYSIAELALRPDPGRLAEIEAHSAVCLACRQVLDDIFELSSRLRSRASRPSTSAGLTDAPPEQERLAADDGGEPFLLGREIARGGMGRIFEAFDTKHGRPVAMKLLLRGGPETARRFAREVRITARLQHPSIIPFYGSGTTRDGAPFFAMKLIEGRSLGEVVAQTREPTARLALLPQIIAVCEALAYAHAEGIVHRDLKPSNVLVGPFGEAVVIDWGLAKEPFARANSDDETIDPDDPRDAPQATLTVTGGVLGTPAYMSPEQASGGDVDARADVYSLGALLYHTLAGAPPYAGTAPEEIVERVKREPPAALAAVVPGLPRDLVTIVEKAMARDAAARYPSAAEMAADLRRLETGQLVRAHAYSLWTLLRRWLARHRAAVTTAAAFLVALATLGVVSVRGIVKERDRADAAKREAIAEREVAVTQKSAAEKLVEFILGDLKTRLQPLGKLDLLEAAGGKVDEYYRAVASRTESADPESIGRHAAALVTLAGVEERKQNMKGAIDLQREATDLRERALAFDPSDAERRYQLASDLGRLGWLESRVSDLKSAKAFSARALEVAGDLVTRDDRNPKYLVALGYAHKVLALVAEDEGDLPHGVDEGRLALDAYKRAAALDASNTEYAYELTGTDLLLGGLLKTSDAAAAAVYWQDCLQSIDRLRAAAPGNRLWDRRSAYCRSGLGRAELDRGEYDLARRDLVASNALRDELRKSDPDNAEWQRDYSGGESLLCVVDENSGRLDDAARECAEALAVDGALHAKSPDISSAAEDFVVSLMATANLDVHRGQPQKGADELRKAIGIADQERKKEDGGAWGYNMELLHKNLADAELALGHPDESLAECARATDFATDVTGALRAQLHLTTARAHGAKGETAATVAEYREAIKLVEPGDAGATASSDALYLADLWTELGEVLARSPGGRAEARDLLGRAKAIFLAHKLAPEDMRYLKRAERGLAGP